MFELFFLLIFSSEFYNNLYQIGLSKVTSGKTSRAGAMCSQCLRRQTSITSRQV